MTTKSFEYKENRFRKGSSFTVRTKGIELTESKTVVKHSSQIEGGNYNVYVVTSKGIMDKLVDAYFDFKPQFNWED